MKRNTWLIFALIMTSLAGSGCRISANFHEVDKGKYYRSAQLTGEELDQGIPNLGIRTIISLRGGNPGDAWFDEEVAVAEKHGAKVVPIGMSAKRLPHRHSLIKLLDTFRDAERPILVHCLAGADRTGEATAIYMMEYMGKSKKKALSALSPRYLHIPISKPAKRYFIRQYQGQDWAYNTYDPCVQSYKYYDKAAYCEAEPASAN